MNCCFLHEILKSKQLIAVYTNGFKAKSKTDSKTLLNFDQISDQIQLKCYSKSCREEKKRLIKCSGVKWNEKLSHVELVKRTIL